VGAILSIDRATLIQSGNGITDGGGGWFIGNFQAINTRRHRENILVKYGIHHAGQECAHPFDPQEKQPYKATVSILVEGGPFVHWFRNDPDKKVPFSDGTTEDVRVLERVGDYLIYEPAALHNWKALGNSVVITMQFPTEEWFKKHSKYPRARRRRNKR
jgi:hypothetical protein